MTATSPRLRAVLGALPAYVPGRSVMRPDGSPAYKLSSNENPYPPLPAVQKVLTDALSGVNRYPDLAATGLVTALAAAHQVEPTQIATGTGSVGVLQQIVQATCDADDEVVYAWRSFEAYPIVTAIAGARSVQVPLLPDERHDLPAMAAAVTDRTRLVLLCTPNNPTGRAIRQGELDELLDAVPGDVLVVLDEAYVEFVRDPKGADGIATFRARENVAVLRTFSKAYGLAGLRVGYAVAPEPVATALRATAVPFGVNILAQVAALASLEARDELLTRVDDLVAEREQVTRALRQQGWGLPDSEANFVWLRLGERTAEFAAACEAAGVVVRAYGTDGCRVTIGEPAANDAFLTVAAEFLGVAR
ncbi:histidinol-phosphate aminotransferase [Motilibacter rhizosphaerae]|uniref:Aromatic amino acid aminotransferase n=1 Tax=Motilibacter rhizosphaerae TaxID=598652 RepID=A0A4V2F4Z2_9ACTN|nr:histidinol-phosphate transaminase [Motilibacter rhizosphaerae]RZS91009.1 histidinol-phosphate aminotransferase [Motilibacter rhizosphaerae]